jgi:hypothetical protein
MVEFCSECAIIQWKCAKNLKQLQILIAPIRKENGGWARTEDEKVETFAEHLVKVFQPFEVQTTPDRGPNNRPARKPI